jgi:hypothetical protein
MLCSDFAVIVGDLVADRAQEARMRDRALRHAAQCVRCAARLDAERQLSLGLRALAANDEYEQAPARLKLALRAAFDRHAEIAAAPIPVASLPQSRSWGIREWGARNWARWGLAAAALLVFAIVAAVLLRNTKTNPNDLSDRDRIDPTPAPAQAPPLAPKSQEQPAPRKIEQNHQNHFAGVNKTRVRETIARVKPRAPRRAITENDVAISNETVTEYIPLTFLADATAVEGGIVVRVELSRSALLALGLPVDMERGDSRVKADMIVGDDGVARAVRFVR